MRISVFFQKFVMPGLILALSACACTSGGKYRSLQMELNEFATDKDATIGVAVIIDRTDTIAVNGDRMFPMLSVYKMPIALAMADYYRANGLTLDSLIELHREDLHLDTYSPMTEAILASSLMLPGGIHKAARELLQYMLQQSDNNASDIVLNRIGGAAYVEDYLSRIGAEGIKVASSEDEMHADPKLCYDNCATPIAMAALFDNFDRDGSDSLSLEIKRIIETCTTGTDRLPKPLAKTDAVIGHKTGTGFTLPGGRLMAVNDAGYVHLPDGPCYSIAVFIEDSGYDMPSTEALIAEISDIVVRFLSEKK